LKHIIHINCGFRWDMNFRKKDITSDNDGNSPKRTASAYRITVVCHKKKIKPIQNEL